MTWRSTGSVGCVAPVWDAKDATPRPAGGCDRSAGDAVAGRSAVKAGKADLRRRQRAVALVPDIKVGFTLLPIDALSALLKGELNSGSPEIDIIQWTAPFAGWLAPHMANRLIQQPNRLPRERSGSSCRSGSRDRTARAASSAMIERRHMDLYLAVRPLFFLLRGPPCPRRLLRVNKPLACLRPVAKQVVRRVSLNRNIGGKSVLGSKRCCPPRRFASVPFRPTPCSEAAGTPAWTVIYLDLFPIST
jgi:hypothetical protein